MAITNPKTLNVRIKNKYDSYENWAASGLVLEAGEIAIAHSSVDVEVDNGVAKQPVLLMRVGNGTDTFKDLPWLSAKAADVLEAAKDADKLTAFINGVIADAGIASDDAMKELAGDVEAAVGRITTLEGEMDAVEKKASDNATAITALQGLVGDQDVATRIANAINALELDKNYDAKGAAAEVQSALNEYKTSNDKAVADNKAAIEAEAATARAAEKANSEAIDAIKDGAEIDSFADVETALAGKEVAGEAAKAEAAAKSYADSLAVNYDAKGSAATAEQNAKDYADGLAGNYDASGSAAKALEDAKDYTDAEILEWVGDKTVAAQIEALKLSETYDAKGAAAAAESAAKAHATGLNTAMDGRVAALEAIDHDHANAAELAKIADGDVAKWNAAEQNAKDYADGLDAAMDLRVDALEAKFGTGEGNVDSKISAAVAAEAKLREDADKAQVERIAALEGKVGEDIVADAISAAVAAEKERAEGIEGGLRTDVDAIKEDYLTSADKEALQDQIDLIIDNPDTENVINSINEFTNYITTHGTIADGFRTDIDANADAIEAVEGRMDTAEGKITALEEASATHAKASDLETLAGRVTTAEGEIDTLQSDLDTAEAAIDALEEKVGEGNVNERIAAAIEALKIGDYAKAADLTAAITQHNTDKAALEASIAKKADDSALAAIAKTGSTDDLVQGEMIILFDCGGAE